MLDLGCCPAGRGAAGTVRRAGGKAVVLAAAAPADLHPAHARPDDPGHGRPGADPGGWAGRTARLVGTSPEAVAAGVPVPLARHLLTWSDVRREVGADRWDAVVVAVPPEDAGELLDAPDLLLRVLDARLDALAPEVGTDPGAAAVVADLLALRPELVALREVAAVAATPGHPDQHGGCRRPGALAVPTVDRDDPLGPPRPALRVRAAGEGFVLALELPPGAVPDLARDGEHLSVRAGPARRTLRLPAALARCRVRAARVDAGLLEVELEPDPGTWGWTDQDRSAR